MADVRIWGIIAAAALASRTGPEHFKRLLIDRAKEGLINELGGLMGTFLDERRMRQVRMYLNAARANHGDTQEALMEAAVSVCRLFVSDSEMMRKLSDAGFDLDVDSLLLAANFFVRGIAEKSKEER